MINVAVAVGGGGSGSGGDLINVVVVVVVCAFKCDDENLFRRCRRRFWVEKIKL